MKEIYKAITDVLVNDTDLKGYVDYTSKKVNIRRGFSIDGEWSKLVVFHLQGELMATDFSPQIRIVPLLVRVYDRENDLTVDDICERIILLLDGADLDVVDKLHVFDCSYDGVLIPLSYNESSKAWEKVLRFALTFRVDSIAGTSGKPVRKRQIGRQGN